MITVHIDGACSPNPAGAMGIAAVIESNGEKLHEICEGFPPAPQNTNNTAEYLALRAALKWLDTNGYCDAPLIIRSDSQMLVSQMRSLWAIGDGLYSDTAYECLELAEDFGALTFEWIPRPQNTRTDIVSKRALRKGQALPTTTNDTF
jgi:ribonuclease HI